MSVSESPCSSSKKLLTDHCSPLTDNCASAANSLLTATPEHPFYSVTRQAFIPVDQLSIGEKLLLSDGSEAIVEKLTLEKAPEGQSFSTYNFEVKDFHTYFVAPKNSPPRKASLLPNDPLAASRVPSADPSSLAASRIPSAEKAKPLLPSASSLFPTSEASQKPLFTTHSSLITEKAVWVHNLCDMGKFKVRAIMAMAPQLNVRDVINNVRVSGGLKAIGRGSSNRGISTLAQQKELTRLAQATRNELMDDFALLDDLLGTEKINAIINNPKKPFLLDLYFGTALETRVASKIRNSSNSILGNLTWTGTTNAPQDFFRMIGKKKFGFDITGSSKSSILKHYKRPEIDALSTFDSIPRNLFYKYRDYLLKNSF